MTDPGTELVDLNLSHDDFTDFQTLNAETAPMIPPNANSSLPNESLTDSISRNVAEQTVTSVAQNVSNAKCWSIEFYQPYFDVDTSTELKRLGRSLIPFRISQPFFNKDEGEKPDLYGPFWIVSTLSFLLAAMGNLSRFLNKNKLEEQWESDIRKISEAATFLYGALFIIPIVLYLIFRQYNVQRSFVEIISVLGYSWTPFILSCILCVVQWGWFKWLSVGIGWALSMTVVVSEFYLNDPDPINLGASPQNQGSDRKYRLYVTGICVLCQTAIALGLKFYFFRY